MAGSTIENITKKPPSGLSLEQWAKIGLQSAKEKIKPPAGLNFLEWAEIGLPSAQEKEASVK